MDKIILRENKYPNKKNTPMIKLLELPIANELSAEKNLHSMHKSKV